MNYRKYIVKGLYVSIALIATFVLYRCFWRQDVPSSTMRDPIVVDEKEEMPEPLAATDANPPLMTPSPFSATQSGPAVREIVDDIPAQDNEQNSLEIGIATFRDSVPEGGALLTGGWAMPNGSHLFLLVSPKMRTDLGSDFVEMSCEFFGISPDLLTDPSWNELLEKNDKGMHLNGSTYNAEQLQEFREHYDSTIRDILSAPRIIAGSGQNAILQSRGVTETRILSVIATHNEASGKIELAVTAAEHE